VTYYGATTIYGHLYRGWFVVFLLAALPCAILLARKIIDSAHRELPDFAAQTSNLLLDFLRIRLGARLFRAIVWVYFLLYFSLLAEELAVSRLMLQTIFPTHPVIATTLLATICLVIMVYLKWGGFKAIMVADYEQLKILIPFLIAMGLLMTRSGDVGMTLHSFFQTRVHSSLATLFLALPVFVAWLIGGVDLYARLNFRSAGVPPTREEHKAFVTLALTMAMLIFLSAALLGMCLPSSFSSIQTPSEFTKRGVQFIVSSASRASYITFFGSFFCMIFTTLNILLFTLVQIGYYTPSKRPAAGDVSRVLLFAVLASCVLWPDSTSAIGIFVGSLMVVPFLVVCISLSDRLTALLPTGPVFLPLSLCTCVAAFAYFHRVLWQYSNHYLLGGITIGAFLLSLLTCKLGETMVRRGAKEC
jgi:hypothetical protein